MTRVKVRAVGAEGLVARMPVFAVRWI